MSDSRLRVVLVDDHQLWHAVVEQVLSPHFAVVGVALDGAKALRVVAATRPDVVLLDLQLPDRRGDELVPEFLKSSPESRILVLSASGEPRDVLSTVKVGASGYLVKSASAEELVAAVSRTAAGEAVFPPGLAAAVLGDLRSGHSNLSEREVEVLRLVARGLTSRQVAERLFLSPRTVENHVNSTLKKLHLKNRVELTRYALDQGL